MATLEVFFTILVLYCTAASLVLAQYETKYWRELPSGRKLLCDRCPPGFRLQAHCTETQPTRCAACDVGYYTQYWNYIYDCLPCNWCSGDEVVMQECTRSSNRVCGCKAGFYRDSYFCKPHRVCEKGYGVKEMGTPDRDTVCEACSEGFYSAGKNTPCIPHTACNSEEKLLFHGTSSFDNVCLTCNNLISDGWVKMITGPLIEIIKNHNNRKLHRYIKQLTNSTNTRKICFVPDHDGCIQLLQQWLSEATEQQVVDLPKDLYNAGVKHLANKLEQKIKSIQDEFLLCKNSFISDLHN
ncbi:tumor necrosis factor receptor superfamily member 11B-like [Clarias gariepinus]|uniref:tumor necrosis factor receptor superfamily member 11B-like n=1 Tax=Clarias gariepinus TaxID=13013 RepID=UPI00234D08D2|nr:tumor necrosis factor receptor superfamily member 11B-like [Clarias gariepinus]